jgi:O-antigen biosynthesis protein
VRGILRRRPRWTIVTAAPNTEGALHWGDTWFAHDLADALGRADIDARVVTRGGAANPDRDRDDVVIVLRGLKRITPRRPRRGGARWILWVISHPELVEPDEMADYDAVFAASTTWGNENVRPLLQATNTRRFTPEAASPDSGAGVLFVGSTRGEFRPAVHASLAAGVELTVYGVGWEAFLPPERIAGEFLANDLLPAAYASAGIVLNDHWREMADLGFLSNRLFDATATGTRVISDAANGLTDVFGSTVLTFRDAAELMELLGRPRDTGFPSREERLELAARVARDHSFDARAGVLIEAAAGI